MRDPVAVVQPVLIRRVNHPVERDLFDLIQVLHECEAAEHIDAVARQFADRLVLLCRSPSEVFFSRMIKLFSVIDATFVALLSKSIARFAASIASRVVPLKGIGAM